MRIGMMADLYKPHVSGVTNHVALNKKCMEAAGHEVFVFTFGDKDYPDDEPNIIRSAGLPVIGDVLEAGIQLNLRHSKHARSLLRTMDIVHLHHPFISGSIALRYCKPRGIPIVFTNHTRYDLHYQSYLPMLPESLGDTFLNTFLPAFCRACDLVIAPSPGMRGVLQHFGVTTPIEVVPNGVDLNGVKKIDFSLERSHFGFSEKDIVMIYAGRLGPEKNLPFLLRAFGGLVQAYPDARLLIVGDGPERENLEDRAAHMGIDKYVHFTGMVPYEEIPGYLAVSDIFTTASVSEVHPLTVIEAMAAGLPILGIESPGVGDTVEDGKTGFLSSHDLAAFTAKMGRLVAAPDERKNMGLEAKKASSKYAIEHSSQILLDCYRPLVEKAASRRINLRMKIHSFFDNLSV
ncbi:MAG: glycosyltransferase [Anaerolineae bacterium]|nr:glycosyltransferase [Anaerolineae bacterium]